MKIDYRYDGTFPGLLSVVFEIYASKNQPRSIEKIYKSAEGLFSNTVYIQTEEIHSKRVLAGLERKMSTIAIKNLYKTMLTELSGAEMHIYGMIKHAFSNVKNIESDYRNQHVSEINKLARKINKEVHRMHAFVRFQKSADDIYMATITPDYDVIPLIGSHFEHRYKDQEWLIYDIKRDYGLYFDKVKVTIVQLNNIPLDSKKRISKSVLNEKEDTFEKLWRQYYHSTNIPERKNLKLHLQHVPKRYWKYLPEKGEF